MPPRTNCSYARRPCVSSADGTPGAGDAVMPEKSRGLPAQSKVPPSTTMPEIAAPCPVRNFVPECTTMCAPCSIGRTR
jgi:hypothetical protein